MKAPQLITKDGTLKLVEPNIERDAPLGVQWLNGELGRVTMQLMGNSPQVIDSMLPTTLEQETARVESFLKRDDQLNWMIEYNGQVVGSAWADLYDSADLPGPSLHIMVGDPAMRGKGVGTSTLYAIVDYLVNQGYDTIYSRHLTTNTAADQLLKSLGFIDLGQPYISETLEFQNLVHKITSAPLSYQG